MGGCGSTCLSPPDIPANPERIDLSHFEQLKVVGTDDTRTQRDAASGEGMDATLAWPATVGCREGGGIPLATAAAAVAHRLALVSHCPSPSWMAGKGGFGKVNAITRKFDGSLMALKRMAKCEVSERRRRGAWERHRATGKITRHG